MGEIVLNMIVGNLPEHYVLYALDNVADFIDYAIINNNGRRADNKERIFKSRFAKEDRLVYIEVPFQDFSQARNACLDCVLKNNPPSWIMRLDADEIHFPEKLQKIKPLLEGWKDNGVGAVRFPFWHLLSWRTYQSYEDCAQLFRWHPLLHWKNPVHEELAIHGTITKCDAEFIHYSYTIPQPEIFGKWQHYVDLVGDYDHYKNRGTKPETVIEDRYQLAGAPWFHEHPPGAKEYIQEKMAHLGYHDGPLPLAVCLWVRDWEKAAMTVTNIRETANPDYPLDVFAFSNQLDKYYFDPALNIKERIFNGQMNSFHQFYERGVDYAKNNLFDKYGNFLFIESGSRFMNQGWQKSLVNMSYCHYRNIDGYVPVGASKTKLIPRDCLIKSPHELRLYMCKYNTSMEEV